MTNQERISELIDEYTRLIAHEHHKTKDGYFYVEVEWDGYAEEVYPKFTALHYGYLHELKGKPRYTYDAAELDLLEFLEEIIENVKKWEPEEDWELINDTQRSS